VWTGYIIPPRTPVVRPAGASTLVPWMRRGIGRHPAEPRTMPGERRWVGGIMETLSISYCRVCGSDMSPDETICAKCGGVRVLKKKGHSTVLLVILVVCGFIAVVLLGIVSAISIPKLSAIRIYDCNTLPDSRCRQKPRQSLPAALQPAIMANGRTPGRDGPCMERGGDRIDEASGLAGETARQVCAA